jgi:hypothetical protein
MKAGRGKLGGGEYVLGEKDDCVLMDWVMICLYYIQIWGVCAYDNHQVCSNLWPGPFHNCVQTSGVHTPSIDRQTDLCRP